MADDRAALYRDLHDHQLADEAVEAARSAERILDAVLARYPVASLLDVGCGLGTWLEVARRRGIADAHGIEGAWARPAPGLAPLIQVLDLERPFDLGRRFDLAISLEVGEHLSDAAAAGFVQSLTRHAPVVLFSAAIPGQGGHHHVNERFLPYWSDLFAAHGYRALDVIRGAIWHDATVLWWLRQNIVLFADDAALARHPGLGAPAPGPLSIVHPDFYALRLQQLQELQKLHAVVGDGGTFRIVRRPNGRLGVTRLPD
jgi:SAM-dependent methyltransferase